MKKLWMRFMESIKKYYVNRALKKFKEIAIPVDTTIVVNISDVGILCIVKGYIFDNILNYPICIVTEPLQTEMNKVISKEGGLNVKDFCGDLSVGYSSNYKLVNHQLLERSDFNISKESLLLSISRIMNKSIRVLEKKPLKLKIPVRIND